jgi:hypothetical protein
VLIADQGSASEEYTLERWDIKAGRRQLAENGSTASVMSATALIFLVFAAAALILCWREATKGFSSTPVIMSFAVCFLGCFSVAMVVLVARVAITAHAPKACRPLVGLPHRLSIGADGLTASGGTAQTVYFWPSIERIDATDDHAFFHSTPNTVVILPRRAFPSVEAFRGFIERARSYCGAFSVESSPHLRAGEKT